MMPSAGLAAWMETPLEERQAVEAKMKAEWDAWMQQNAASLKETAGAGSTKRVTKEGVVDVKNDVMMYSIVEAESPESAAKMFEGHPHLGIPEAWIDIMPANVLSRLE
jgi:hypothetical protein